MSELDATQTLWIDVDSFVPKRYEFEYSSPGFGDIRLRPDIRAVSFNSSYVATLF